MTDVVVELIDRRPIRVLWTTFSILTLDGEGYCESIAFERHQPACAEPALAPPVAEPERAATVADGANRFVAQGGRWAPSRTLARRIDEAAQRRVKSGRL
jgi:hypothetical protein